MTTQFSSDGFDLDAIPDAGTGDNVIYEVGGCARREEKVGEEDAAANDSANDANDEELSPLARSENFKAQGNEEFKNKNYLEACDMYGAAIETCPGMTGDEILKLREDFEQKENEKLMERHRLEAQSRRRKQEDTAVENPPADDDASLQPAEFSIPPHPHAENLGIYYCNRAACYLHLQNYEDAVKDSDIAILLRPDWSKAYVRRSLAYENLEKTDLALSDAKKAAELDPSNVTIRKTVARLQKIEDERLEELKEETLGKLKDLGNSLLSNFGLSLDNFKAQQDPNTGSYSISFDQSANKA